MYKNIEYFKGLNALRFFAAYFVVMHHAEQIRLKYELFNLKSFSIFNNGGVAVNFFFVLSGFLITYLLLKEYKKTGTVSIKKFYVRRILRIWPLYFFLVLLGTVIVPVLLSLIGNNYQMPYHFNDVILYYIFFTPFMVNIFFGHHLLEPLWSIGVEELFYIIWAPLFKFLRKNIVFILIGIVLLKFSLYALDHTYSFSNTISSVINMLSFETMAIGGFAAFFVYNAKNDLSKNILFSKISQLVIILFITIRLFAYNYTTENIKLLATIFNTPVISNFILNIAFAWLIVNISVNSQSIIKLNNKLLNYLGEISYGIYMYHMLVVFSVVLIFKNTLNNLNNTISTIIFYGLVTLITVLVSGISKKLFEDRFLKLKLKFE